MENRNKIITTKFLLVIIGVCMTFISCTKVDDLLGENLVPDNGEMKIDVMKIGSINSYTKRIDSLITSSWETKYIGSIISPEFGLTNCGMMSQYIFNGFKSDYMWGDSPTIDSVILSLSIKGTIGDTLYQHTIDMYELNKKLPSTNKFYSDFDIEAYIPSEPVKTFIGKKEGNYIKTRLPISFAERFLDTTGRVYYYDSLFYDKYYGSYFKVKNNNNRGNLLNINMQDSKISIYYHNKNIPNPDTTVFLLLYTNDRTISTNKSFTTIKHDYTLADPIIGVKLSTINDTLNPQTLTYVQGMGGLTTMLEVNKEEIDRILKSAKEEGYSNVVINSAILKIMVNSPSIPVLNNSLNRLGMYYDYPNIIYIPDYNPFAESDSYALPFDGYLNRALEGYNFDITLYLQDLIKGDNKQYKIDVSAAYNNEHFPIGSFLDNSSSSPIELSVTYTMIK